MREAAYDKREISRGLFSDLKEFLKREGLAGLGK